MKRRDVELIAAVLGDRRPAPELARWLATDEGRRELAAHRRALDALRELYGPRAVERASASAAVHYTSLAAPIGRVLVAVGDAGLVRVSFRQSEATFVAELERQLGMRAVRSPSETAEVVEQLRAYFAGRRRRFDVPVDLRHVTPFVRRVLTATMQVPAGNLVSYGDIARRIGQPKGSRAVGQALGRNPIPIVIPCHRVIAAGGRIGGYTGGLAIKRRLLRLEGSLAAAS
jgi:methylated-DNA-[protein]-cysteine S-methyltransferase